MAHSYVIIYQQPSVLFCFVFIFMLSLFLAEVLVVVVLVAALVPVVVVVFSFCVLLFKVGYSKQRGAKSELAPFKTCFVSLLCFCCCS